MIDFVCGVYMTIPIAAAAIGTQITDFVRQKRQGNVNFYEKGWDFFSVFGGFKVIVMREYIYCL